MSYKEKAIKGVSWNLLSYLLTIPISYGIRVLYAHELPKEDVGLFYALLDLFSLLTIFRGLGIDHGIVRFIPKYLVKKEYEILKGLILFGGVFNLFSTLLITLIILYLAPFIIRFYFSKSFINFSGILYYFTLLSIGFYFLDGVLGFIGGLLQGFQKQHYVSSTRVLRMFIIFLFSLFFIYVFNVHNALTPILSYSLMPLILILIYGIIFFKSVFPEFFKIKYYLSFNLIKEITSYSFYIIVSSIGGLILGYMDGICLNLFKGLNVVADYRNVAMPTTNIIMYISLSITTVLFPMISELWEKNDKKLLTYGIEKAYIYILTVALPLSLILFMFPTVIVNLLFGSSYLTASNIIKVLSFSALFSSLSSLGFTVLNGIGLVRLSSKIIYIGAFCNLIFNLILIPIFGGVGAGLATLISYLIMCLIQIRFINRLLEYNFLSKKIIYIFLLSFISLTPIILLKGFLKEVNIYLQILIYLSVYFGVYLLGIIKTKVIDIQEIKKIIKI